MALDHILVVYKFLSVPGRWLKDYHISKRSTERGREAINRIVGLFRSTEIMKNVVRQKQFFLYFFFFFFFFVEGGAVWDNVCVCVW